MFVIELHRNNDLCLQMFNRKNLASGSADSSTTIWDLTNFENFHANIRNDTSVNCLKLIDQEACMWNCES